jgi:hypothetical protein
MKTQPVRGYSEFSSKMHRPEFKPLVAAAALNEYRKREIKKRVG